MAWVAPVAGDRMLGTYDEERLRSKLERLVARDSRKRGWDAAYLDALQRDLAAHPETGYGNLSGLLLMSITSNWAGYENRSRRLRLFSIATTIRGGDRYSM